MKKLFLLFLAVAGVFSACGGPGAVTPTTPPTTVPATTSPPETLSVETVALPENFFLGMDASCVPALEQSGVRYFDRDGRQKDVFQILSENGVNCIRVRVWNDPYTADGKGYGGGNCDIENAIAIGNRAAKYGMTLFVDFHYSDFWADPGKQMVPKAWKGLTFDEKCDALYAYTKDCLEKLQANSIPVSLVQIGNETTGALCGEAGNWENICRLLSAGSRAVREVLPEARVAVHFTNPEKAGTYAFYGKTLADNGVDYDVFASSYYPFWHGSLENLSAELSQIARTYGKQVMVAETSYPFTAKDTDFSGNTVSSGISGYPVSPQGQASFFRDVVDRIATKTENGIGVFYWEGTWISVGGESWQENSALWEKYGSGWASSHAAEYDPEDAGKWYGGCAVDNQAFFDETGRATEALAVFNLLKQP